MSTCRGLIMRIIIVVSDDEIGSSEPSARLEQPARGAQKRGACAEVVGAVEAEHGVQGANSIGASAAIR